MIYIDFISLNCEPDAAAQERASLVRFLVALSFPKLGAVSVCATYQHRAMTPCILLSPPITFLLLAIV